MPQAIGDFQDLLNRLDSSKVATLTNVTYEKSFCKESNKRKLYFYPWLEQTNLITEKELRWGVERLTELAFQCETQHYEDGKVEYFPKEVRDFSGGFSVILIAMLRTVSLLAKGAPQHVYIDTAHFLDFVLQNCQQQKQDDLSAFAAALKTGFPFLNGWGRQLWLSAVEHCLGRFKRIQPNWHSVISP